ncbi:translation initiation factor IF-2 [Texas Phoenix palm phytoplasma]
MKNVKKYNMKNKNKINSKNLKNNLNLIKRTPIVTIMGHVNSGKTTLLDSIRKTRLVDKEFGGITQHIGAYEIKYKKRKVTFLDTPGHEAFCQMRSRGVQLTDICLLVIAGDDGIKPQTIESIKYAQEANVEIIVVLNKIDKVNYKKDSIMTELSNLGLVSEEWGGKTIFVEISALKNQGINELLQMIFLVSDIKDIKTDLTKKAEGVVLEAGLDKNKGPVATLISSQGILKIGDILVVGESYGKIRALEDDLKNKLKEVFPSQPSLVIGLKQVPQVGDKFFIVESTKEARKIVENKKHLSKIEKNSNFSSNESEYNILTLQDENKDKFLNIILKADTQGSIESIKQTLEKLHIGEVKVNLIKTLVGMVTIKDIDLAKTFDAFLINFNTVIDNNLLKIAQNLNVEIKNYNILYEMIRDVEKKLKDLVKPIFEEKVTGKAEIKKIFNISSIGSSIAGCYVKDGIIFNNSLAKVIRNNKIIYKGKIISLKHLKNNISKVTQGHECGILLENFNNFMVDDIIESSILEKVSI